MTTRTRQGSYGHSIQRMGGGLYRIAWSFDMDCGRHRSPIRHERITDAAGAKRFAKKWDLEMPTEVA